MAKKLGIQLLCFWLASCSPLSGNTVSVSIDSVPTLNQSSVNLPFCGRVASYNIRHGCGMDNRVDLARTADAIKSFDADFVGLQEVDNKVQRSGGVDQIEYLKSKLGMHGAFGKFMDYDGGEYGMGFLSKHPIVKIEYVKLPPGGESRIALAVETRLPNGESIVCVVVHFDWVGDDRVRFEQAKVLQKYLKSLTIPCLLVGDFNDKPGSRTLDLFNAIAVEATKNETNQFTFRADQPDIEIDFIFGQPQTSWKFDDTKVVDEKVASDHRPVVSNFVFSPSKEPASTEAAAPKSAGLNDSSSKPAQPNIVFIFSDDHAVQAIGAYGSTINQTPRIDQLAKQGMIFDRSFCGNSICGPSRASVLTGKHSHVNGFMRNGDRFIGAQVTFPKLLQQNGYQTALIGKWHLESDPTGFDFWDILPDQGSYYNPDFIQMNGSRKRYEGYCTDLISDQSLDWLNRRDKNRPFLLMCQHKAPHRNWSPHPRHFGRYQMGTIPEPETLFDDYAGRTKLLNESEMSIAKHFYWGHDMKFHGANQFPQHFLSGLNNGEYARMSDVQKAAWDAHYEPENQSFLEQLRAGQLSDQEIVRWKYQRYLHDYLGSVEAVDENVGRILDYLDENGLAENTIVIYASDQGFYLGEHGWYDKRWMFEESLRMPFLIRWPGVVEAGVRSSAMIQNIDYAPTILEIAGVDSPSEMQGASFLPILKNRGEASPDWRSAIYYAFYEATGAHKVAAHDGIRTEKHKLIYFPKTNEWNLFDLESDPHELTSRHDDPAYSTTLSMLQKRYLETRQHYRVHSAVIQEARENEKWWVDRFEAKLKQAQQQDEIDLVFLGDSITQGWEGPGKAIWDEWFGKTKTLNIGFSGDRTEHLIWRLRRNSFQGKQPEVAVIMIGTNNTGHKMQAPEETADGIREIVNTLNLLSPETKILLLGVFPRGESSTDLARLNNVAINDLISQLPNGENVVYLDLTDTFLEANRTITKEVMPDFLHLSEEGYRRWAEGIAPTLKKWSVLTE